MGGRGRRTGRSVASHAGRSRARSCNASCKRAQRRGGGAMGAGARPKRCSRPTPPGCGRRLPNIRSLPAMRRRWRTGAAGRPRRRPHGAAGAAVAAPRQTCDCCAAACKPSPTPTPASSRCNRRWLIARPTERTPLRRSPAAKTPPRPLPAGASGCVERAYPRPAALQPPDPAALLDASDGWVLNTPRANTPRAPACWRRSTPRSCGWRRSARRRRGATQGAGRERTALTEERARLQCRRRDHARRARLARRRHARSIPGAPLWQLVDFAPASRRRNATGSKPRSGAGLLDAWVTPDGALLQGPGGALARCQWRHAAARRRARWSAWLQPTWAPASVGAETVGVAGQHGLRRIAATATSDDGDTAEAWLADDGRFPSPGSPAPRSSRRGRHIGHAARDAARRRRLAEIARGSTRWRRTTARQWQAQWSGSTAAPQASTTNGARHRPTSRCAPRSRPPLRPPRR